MKSSRTFSLRIVNPTTTENWAARSTGPGVVWAHDFGLQAEVDQFLKLPNQRAKPDSAAPSGFSANEDITFGTHDPVLHARRVADPASASGFAIEILNLGARLARDLTAAATEMVLTAAAAPFPDPADDPAKAYWVAVHAKASLPQYMGPGATPGSKGWKELVAVKKKVSNPDGTFTFSIARGLSYSESPASGGTSPKAFLAGCPVGVDSAGGWARPLCPLEAGSNGKATPDLAVGGTLRRRRMAPRDVASVRDGYYAHRFYHSLPEFQGWKGASQSVFDGDEFWLQFRMWISPRRRDPDVPGGKMWFLHTMGRGGAQQIVGGGVEETDGTAEVFGDYGQEKYTRGGKIQPVASAPGGSAAPSCVVGNKASCFQWPLGAWFTTLIHVKAGYSRDQQCPQPGAGDDTYASLTVDTTAFTPTNDGTRLVFETTLPPLFRYWPRSRHLRDYFKNWAANWPTSTSGATWPSAAAQFAGGTTAVTSSEVRAGRMRWTLEKRGSGAFPSGTPSMGHVLRVEADGQADSYAPELRNGQFGLWVQTADGVVTQLYGIDDQCWIFGDGGYNKWVDHPPAWNCFQPTGYSNIWDNLSPHPSSSGYRFAEVVLSQQFIPWPALK